MSKRGILSLAVALMIAGPAVASSQDEVRSEFDALRNKLEAQHQQMQQRLAEQEARNRQLEQEVSSLRADRGESWMNERRAEEMKGLIREVLADADTRASLLDSGLSAGHNGTNFYLASEDGNFLLTLGGQVQVRFLLRTQELSDSGGDPVENDDVEGFEVPRAKLKFDGHIYSPKLRYSIWTNVSRSDNSIYVDRAFIEYDIHEQVTLWAGERKAPFLREELTDSAYQLAVERSLVNEIFTMGTVQGVGMFWKPAENVIVSAALSDGIRSGEAEGAHQNIFETGGDGDVNHKNRKPFDRDQTDFALGARVDWAAYGTWDQYKDFSAWDGEELGVFVGAAFHYEDGVDDDEDDETTSVNFLAWTIDASAEYKRANLFVALIGADADYSELDDQDWDAFAVVVQGGYMLVPDEFEVFARWEYVDIDAEGSFDDVDSNEEEPGTDEFSIITLGANYYLHKHASKLSMDIVIGLDTLPSFAGLGIDQSIAAGGIRTGNITGLFTDEEDQDGQVVVRLQYQLLF
jgi:hypothetical protein